MIITVVRLWGCTAEVVGRWGRGEDEIRYD